MDACGLPEMSRLVRDRCQDFLLQSISPSGVFIPTYDDSKKERLAVIVYVQFYERLRCRFIRPYFGLLYFTLLLPVVYEKGPESSGY